MITSSAFLTIEKVLSSRLTKEMGRISEELFSKVDAALSSEDYDKALSLVKSFSLAPLRDEVSDFVLYMTHVAMLFGASRVTQLPGTSVVGLGFESVASSQMAGVFLQSVCQKAEVFLKERAERYISNASLPAPPLAIKAEEPILQPFASFMDNAGRAFFNTASSLHTSRVSGYGFTAEAEVLGLVEYQISEQLDVRICPVCAHMHGKTFKVSDARAFLSKVTRVTDPDDLKQLQPWPKQDEASLTAFKELTADELVARGWHVPPYHPRCRGLLTRKGKVPSLESVSNGTFQEKYVASKEDFSFLGVTATPSNVKAWNSSSQIAPAELVSRLQGAPVDSFLASVMGGGATGIDALTFDKKGVTLQLTAPGFGAEKVVQKVRVLGSDLVLDRVNFTNTESLVDSSKAYLRELYAASKDLGAKTLSYYAEGPSWARFGFKPELGQWELLKKDLAAKESGAGLTELQNKLYQSVLSSNDPSMIFLLSDAPFGSALLEGLSWRGSLSLTDEESVIRFLTFIGELK